MAKLEDRITPQYLLTSIRSGAPKIEITKEFRTNDRELAHMLLPLYRSGEMTKEEFNDFFKGVAVKGQAVEEAEPSPVLAPAESPETKNVLEAPAEEAQAKPQGALAKLISGLWQVAPPPGKPNNESPGEAAEPRELLSELEEAALAEAPQSGAAEQRRPKGQNGQATVHKGQADRRVMAPPPDLPAATEASSAPETHEVGIELVLNTILARLDSIDARLSRIESMLDLH